MTEVTTTPRPPLTLPEEHRLLLWQVNARAEELLTATSQGRWPAAELEALASYAQAEVLRQASDEEALVFPVTLAHEASGLARDHARLRAAAELLGRAAAGKQPLSLAQVATAARDFVTQLTRHVQAEETLLAVERAPRRVPATATLGGHSHEWYPLTEGSLVDLDLLPRSQALSAAVDRVLRMHRGEQVELGSSANLDPLWREISHFCPDSYLFTVLQDGPPRWRMQVTRRQVAAQNLTGNDLNHKPSLTRSFLYSKH